jgi:hypothetical protein
MRGTASWKRCPISSKRFPQADATFDGILCWDVIDYLDRASAHELAVQMTRVLRPDGALLGFFAVGPVRETRYTKYVIVDEVNLQHRPYPASRAGARALNRDIIRMFRLAGVKLVPPAEQSPRDPLQKPTVS